MNSKKWKIGFRIATLFGLLSAGAGLVGDMGWKSFVAVLCAALITNLGSYLMKHPIESIKDEDEPTNRPPSTTLLFLLLSLALVFAGCLTGGDNRNLGGPFVHPDDESPPRTQPQ